MHCEIHSFVFIISFISNKVTNINISVCHYLYVYNVNLSSENMMIFAVNFLCVSSM